MFDQINQEEQDQQLSAERPAASEAGIDNGAIIIKSHAWRNWSLIAAIIVILGAGGWWYYSSRIQNQLPTVSNDDNQVNAPAEEIADEGKQLENVFAEYVLAGQNGDFEKIVSLMYGSEATLKSFDLIATEYPGGREALILMASEEMQGVFSNFDYVIEDKKITDNNAYILVKATKNGRIKASQPVFFIKENNQWQINSYGWSHPADTVSENSNQCTSYCQSAGYGSSGHLFSQENQCFCYYHPPEIEDLSALNVEQCEQEEINFRASCYLSYAESQQNEEYCKKINDRGIKGRCYEDLAILKKDASICDYLWDDTHCLELTEDSAELFNQAQIDQITASMQAKLSQTATPIILCLDEQNLLNKPESGQIICAGSQSVWPDLNEDYKYDEDFGSNLEVMTWNFSVSSDSFPAIDCDQTGCVVAEEDTLEELEIIDTDNDGLSDNEEVLLWQTDPQVADTDGDGYLDGAEVINGYNPLGEGKLNY